MLPDFLCGRVAFEDSSSSTWKKIIDIDQTTTQAEVKTFFYLLLFETNHCFEVNCLLFGIKTTLPELCFDEIVLFRTFPYKGDYI